MNIDTDLVRRLINSQFPKWQDCDIKPVSQQGWDNRTFHLGADMSIRLPSSKSYGPQAEKEQTWLPFLSQKLSLQIPVLLSRGNPSELFPYAWGVYKWLDGDSLEPELINDISSFAKDIAHFLTQLQKIDTANAPLAGPHCFYRGAALEIYDAETKRAIQNLSEILDLKFAKEIWDKAVGTKWQKPSVWFHGDIAKGNILIKNGKLYAIIDFGCCGVGDPACDLSIAWTFLTKEPRRVFKSALDLDEATWQRGRAWALWKALITIEGNTGKVETNKAQEAIKTLKEIFDDYALEQEQLSLT
jgi:aminoglycoside phosphotransferase (APT) family kinase protein